MSSKFGISKLGQAFSLMLKQAKSKETVKMVGKDHLGNKYFEANKPNHWRPVQRYYDAPKPVESFDQIVEAVHVPPAWDAWLRFRRQEPPSEEEVMESEQYYQMQQEMASSKKKAEEESEPMNKPTSFKEDGQQAGQRKVPSGHYSKNIYD